jgi:hypothetical protein
MRTISQEYANNLLCFAEFAMRAVQSNGPDPKEHILNAGIVLGLFELDDTKGRYHIKVEREQTTPRESA